MAWFDTFDDEGKAFVTSKGWNALEGDAAAGEATKAYRELQKLHGSLAGGTAVMLPKADDEAAVAAFWEKLGAPKEAAGYKFDGVTYTTGETPEEDFLNAAREAGLKARIPATQLGEFVKNFLPYIEREEAADKLASEAASIESKQKLEAEWGANLAKNKFIASNAMNTLGVTPDTVTALEGSLGYQAVMNHFLKLGEIMGEARFVPGGGNNAPMNSEQARSELERLQNDDGFRARWASGDLKAIEQKTNLIKIITGANK